MSDSEPPKGLRETAVFMSITNAMGWAVIDWSKPDSRVLFIAFTIFIVIGYVVIWFYLEGSKLGKEPCTLDILSLPLQFVSLEPLRANRACNGGSKRPCWQFFFYIGLTLPMSGHSSAERNPGKAT
jgi:hypothetical protein